jgi:putative ABC transport system substrate-binding protein
MKRRTFITLLSGAPTAWAFAAHAQQSRKLPLIGFLGPTTPAAGNQWVATFIERLHELQWIEGRTVEIDYLWAGGRTERFAELASDFIRRKVDVIMTWGTATAIAAKQATSTIPIVFTIVGDPIDSGLVATLARPGGNVTGLSTQHADTTGKRLGQLIEIVPNLRRVAVMANAGNSGPMLEMREIEAKARALGLDTVAVEVRKASDIAPAIGGLKDRAEALYVTADAMFNTNRDTINAASLDARLPTMHGVREIVAAGGLISYAASYPSLFRRAADFVDKVLRGTKPADIPVEQPTKFDLVVNLSTAKKLGLNIPESFLVRADEVIE